MDWRKWGPEINTKRINENGPVFNINGQWEETTRMMVSKENSMGMVVDWRSIKLAMESIEGDLCSIGFNQFPFLTSFFPNQPSTGLLLRFHLFSLHWLSSYPIYLFLLSFSFSFTAVTKNFPHQADISCQIEAKQTYPSLDSFTNW